jgi:hypothetical protein
MRVLALKFKAKNADIRLRTRVFMFGRFRHFLPAAAWVLGVATVVADPGFADAGYLPSAGPVPLRFRVLPPPAKEGVNAPVAPAPPAAISLPSPPMPVGPKEPTNAPPIPALQNGPPLEYNAREPVTSAMPATAPDAVVSPQMLMKYFTPGPNPATNEIPVGAQAPVDFNSPLGAPPKPLPPPSSKGASPNLP